MRFRAALPMAVALALSTAAGPPPTSRAALRGHYAAPPPAGSPGGDGTTGRPWDLATALAGGRGRVQPGDTVWLRGGTYRGAFRSTLQGREGMPVVVRQYPGERTIIDGAGSTKSTFYVGGEYSVFWGFELTNSDPVRTTSRSGHAFRPDVVVNYAPHVKYINLVVHDGGVAFYTEPRYPDVEIVGTIIYNNGWQGPERGGGHGLYVKNFTGPLVARDNVLFNQYGYGVHAYTNASTGKLVNIRIEGNVSFNNGMLARGSSGRSSAPNLLLGGDGYATGDVVRENLTYFSPGATRANAMIGWKTLTNGDVIVERNYFAGGSPVLEFGFWTAARVTNNTFVQPGRSVGASLIKRNDPKGSGGGQIWRDNVEERNPTVTKVVIRANPYESGRAHVVVFNWGKQRAVQADVRGILRAGDRYEVRNVQDLFGAPVVSGVVAGTSITIPLGGLPPPTPVGLASSPAPQTGPEFDVFLITRAPPR